MMMLQQGDRIAEGDRKVWVDFKLSMSQQHDDVAEGHFSFQELCRMWDAAPNYSTTFSAAEASAGAFCAILGDALQEQFQQFWWSLNKINKNDKLFWKYDLKWKVEGMGLGFLRTRRLWGKCIF